MSKSKVWLVTGSASGLGRHIAEAVLAAGDRLVATARDPRRLADLVERYGDRVRIARLDVTEPVRCTRCRADGCQRIRSARRRREQRGLSARSRRSSR